MADDYARHALSQRAAFETTHPAVLAAARLFADEAVLRVVDLGAADGVNSHGLIRELAEERAGRPLIYALVDRRAWRVAAARQWERLLEMRAVELAPGGRFIATLPASPAPCPERTGLYAEIIGDMNLVLADWCRAGRIDAATVAAVVVPVWIRTLAEIRDPFNAGGGRIAGLEFESAELFRLDNPYWHDDPAVFARGYVRSVTAWAGRSSSAPSRTRARTAPPVSSPTFSESSRSASRTLPTATAGTTFRPSSSAGRWTGARATGRTHKTGHPPRSSSDAGNALNTREPPEQGRERRDSSPRFTPVVELRKDR